MIMTRFVPVPGLKNYWVLDIALDPADLDPTTYVAGFDDELLDDAYYCRLAVAADRMLSDWVFGLVEALGLAPAEFRASGALWTRPATVQIVVDARSWGEVDRDDGLAAILESVRRHRIEIRNILSDSTIAAIDLG